MTEKNSTSVFLYGAWKKNLGDDLFLKITAERYPDCNFHILTLKQYADTYLNIPNVTVHHKDNRMTQVLNNVYRKLNKPDYAFIKMAETAEAVIFLGGSLYQQEKNWKRLYIQRKNIQSLFKASFAVGNNFGPYSDDDFYHKYQSFFKNMTDVCFRDQYSGSLFPYDNIRTASDVVFGIKSVYSDLKPDTDKSCSKPVAVISVINLELDSVSRKFQSVTAEQYENWIAKLAAALEKRGYLVTLMGFCRSEGDEKAIDRIIENPALKHTEKYIHENIDESLCLIKNSELVIATRFHAMIVGWAFEKKVVPVAYGNKMRNVIRDVGFDGCSVDIENLEEHSIDYIIDHAEKLDNTNDYYEDSMKQFAGFDTWLQNKK